MSWQKKKGNSQRPKQPAKYKPIKPQSTKTNILQSFILTVHEPDLERKKEGWDREKERKKGLFLVSGKMRTDIPK